MENQKTNQNVTPIKTIYDPARGWVCQVCGKAFKTRNSLVGHIASHKPHRKGQVSLNHYTHEQKPASSNGVVAVVPEGVIYEDWCNAIPILRKAYEQRIFVLIIGPKGTGKTTLVRKFAEMMNKPLYTVNFSLRTKESHLVGTTVLENGTTRFAMGIIPRSMQEGAILYLDELNAAEADVLLRLDEALDDRRELNIKEAGEVIKVKAHPDWFVIATINPLSHVGTKELPPQLLSRFPVRLYLDYPPPEVELKIVEKHVGDLDYTAREHVVKAIQLSNKLREMAKAEEIYYSPSIRETIAFAKMLMTGLNPKDVAELVFANAYWQWGQVAYSVVKNLIVSLWGE